ncbi:MAG: DUF3854 domain-containing protein [Thermomicrobiales bacterium]
MLTEGSGIAPDLIASEGIRGVWTKGDLKAEGFHEDQWQDAGILFPRRRPGSPEVVGHTYRPDVCLDNRKYQTAAGSANILDTPLAAQPFVDDPNVPLMVTEGIKKALAYVSRGGKAVVSVSGVYGWRGTNSKGGKVALPDWENVALHGRTVYVAFDSDAWRNPHIKQAMARLARFLESKGARVLCVRFEDAPDGSKVGMDDFLLTHTVQEMYALATPLVDDRPRINATSANVVELVDTAIQAVIDTGFVYRQGGQIVMVEEAGEGQAEAFPVNEHLMVYILGACVNCVRPVQVPGPSGPTWIEVSVAPPLALAKLVLSRQAAFPLLQRIVRTPVVSPSGRILRESGYDAETRLYLDLISRCNVPDHPTHEDVTAAVGLIMQGLNSFPLDSAASLAHAFVLMAEPFVRPLIAGPTPLHLVESPTQGSGKGKLVSLTQRPSLRGPVTEMSVPTSDEEMGKLITTKAREGASVFLLDNLKDVLASAALAQGLTSGMTSGRILGVTQSFTSRITWVWIVTANNPALDHDIARRTVRTRLEPNVEEPWRLPPDAFPIPNIDRWAVENEGRLTDAVLTIVQSWVRAGMPRGKERLGSFEEWAAVMGGILAHAGIDGFLGNLDELYDAANTERDTWRTLVTAWWDAFGDEAVAVTKLYELAVARELDLPVSGKDEAARRRSLGLRLNQQKGRIYQDLRITSPGKVAGGAKAWKLVPIGNPPPRDSSDRSDRSDRSALRPMETEEKQEGQSPVMPVTPVTDSPSRRTTAFDRFTDAVPV